MARRPPRPLRARPGPAHHRPRMGDRASNAIDAHHFEGLRPITAAFRAAAHGLLGDAAASAAAADEVDRPSRGSAPSRSSCPSGGHGRSSPPAISDRRATCSSRRPMTPSDPASSPPPDGCSTTPPAWVPPTWWQRAWRRWPRRPTATWCAFAPSTSRRSSPATPPGLARPPNGSSRSAPCSSPPRPRHRLLTRGVAVAMSGGRLSATRASELAAAARARGPRCWSAPARSSLSAARARRRRAGGRGLTSREIAAQLSLSVRTVDNHLGRIYAKFGVSSRARLGRRARRSGGGRTDMTPEQLAMVRIVRGAGSRHDQMASDFYSRLFAADPRRGNCSPTART